MPTSPKARLLALLLISLVGLLAVTAVLAQTSGSYDLSWHVIGSGGGESASAGYRVNGTIGQGLASPPLGASSSYQVSSGYWFVDPGSALYLPVVLKE